MNIESHERHKEDFHFFNLMSPIFFFHKKFYSFYFRDKYHQKFFLLIMFKYKFLSKNF
ncbi:hypothetical protein Calab_0572 [Caldithrix abyssi DSM 13497]|uniref:Uncharacterized protein n=1 Tax=Caldithrix abyssi DSM 13497 TaxID=880073 RepID=H1XS51_CALAY|nr:hypothetical protein Cabys_3406 [Caldithrix abyssi DSM 13497]EHO40215.1 hypothetical protein Calab_0572 [Caldithrix abyssi DSM 13497]